MSSVRTVLVVGGGIAGATLAALLARAGVAVEIVERTPRRTAPGHGITLKGAALRVLDRVGVLDALRAQGCVFEDLTLRLADGRVQSRRPISAMIGVYRSELVELLTVAALEAGAKLRLGASVTLFTQNGDGVDVVFSDGDAGRYDLLVGADGARSTIRSRLGIDAAPAPVGMGIWRVHARRPAAVRTVELCYDGPCYVAGVTPTGPNTVCAYLVEPARHRFCETPEEKVVAMRAPAAAYHGPWDDIRDDITDAGRIEYTWFEHLLVEGPWNRGRVVLIGDAAHACPPTLAQGAAQALEDAVVLAELLLAADTLDDALWQAFMDRRFHRAETVVDASLQLARWLLAHERGDVPALMERVARVLGSPA